ncbi:MAG: prephenate dehydrogenase [Candidatus Omnitrophica bacterium]|nr:prephenate dehydrogenase [Candidatus Omnitrophota bacterium]
MRLKFKKTVIVGPGLIGGSIGIFLRESKITSSVVGVTRHKDTLSKAVKKGAIDKAEIDLKKAVIDADLVLIATPVEALKKIIREIKNSLKPGCIVFDVGSTKREIVLHAEKMLPGGVYFVGSHPMAGSEKTGVEFARADLFNGSICFITKTKTTNKTAILMINELWKRLGAKCVEIDPCAHDDIVASVSHLPHLISAALVNSVPAEYLKFAGAGFKDSTRIAAASAEIWHDITLSNRKAILKQIKRFESVLKKLKKSITLKQGEQLIRQLDQAKKKRQSI